MEGTLCDSGSSPGYVCVAQAEKVQKVSTTVTFAMTINNGLDPLPQSAPSLYGPSQTPLPGPSIQPPPGRPPWAAAQEGSRGEGPGAF